MRVRSSSFSSPNRLNHELKLDEPMLEMNLWCFVNESCDELRSHRYFALLPAAPDKGFVSVRNSK
jgi:hypothetical protein